MVGKRAWVAGSAQAVLFVGHNCDTKGGRNADSMQLAQSVPAKGDRDAHAMASKGSHAALWDPWTLGKWLPLLLLPFPFLLAARNLRGRPPAAAGEASAVCYRPHPAILIPSSHLQYNVMQYSIV